MRAVVRDHYCDESRIAVRDIALPECAPGEVLIKMTSASLGPDVWHMLTGLPLAGRLAFGLRAPRSNRLGSDFAGVVQKLPSSATELVVGDRVAGHTHGAFAEYLAVPADGLSRIPDGVTDAQACALPVSGATALAALRKVEIDSSTSILVIGAAGGIGHLLVQLAALRSPWVTGVCRPAAKGTVTALGAADTIDYTNTPIHATGRRWDVIVDTAGRRPIRELRRSLTAGGSIVVIGGEGGGKILGGFGREILAAAPAALAHQRVRGLLGMASKSATDQLLALTDTGRLRPLIHTELPMDRAADGLRLLRGGHLRGKIVLTA